MRIGKKPLPIRPKIMKQKTNTPLLYKKGTLLVMTHINQVYRLLEDIHMGNLEVYAENAYTSAGNVSPSIGQTRKLWLPACVPLDEFIKFREEEVETARILVQKVKTQEKA